MDDNEPTQSEAEEANRTDPKDSASSAQKAPNPIGWRSALSAFVLLILICFLVKGCNQPPSVRGADAEPELFSAERAVERLNRLLGDQSAHPIGTAENDQVRKRLLAELTGLGLEPTSSDHWVSNEHLVEKNDDGEYVPSRAWVSALTMARNVMAPLPTTNPDLPALILACHYDSVPAGPGAGDDGAAVAALLEVARALMLKGPLARPVILLFTDGEELGLYGAQAFCENNPLADSPQKVGLVLNFEARGSSGPSLMFETSKNNRWLIEQASAGLDRPMSSSAYVEIYRLMPNGSDLTVFMENEMPGMNFAFLRNPKHYHTPFDNLKNLDHQSLQHHGDNALGMVLQLLEADWEGATDKEAGDAVYTDVFARWILAWKTSSGPPFAAFFLGVLLVVLVILSRRHRWWLARISGTLLCWICIILLAAILSWVAAFLLDLKEATPTRWPDAFHLDVMVHCLFAAFGILFAIFFFRGERTLFFLIHGIVMSLIGFVLAINPGEDSVVGFSYLFILPGLASAVGGLLLLRKGTSELLFAGACLLPAFVTAIIWVPLLMRMPLALGVMATVAPAFGVIFVILLLPLVPILIEFRGRALLAISLGLVALTGWSFRRAVLTDPFTEDAPQQVNLIYVEQEGLPQAKLVIQALEGFEALEAKIPDSLFKNLTSIKKLPPTTFAGRHAHGGSKGKCAFTVDSEKVPAPEVELLSHEKREGGYSARFRLRPVRDSQYLMVGIPDTNITLEGIEIAGEKDLPIPSERVDCHKWLRVRGAPPEGVEIELEWTGPAEFPLTIAGITSGLPPNLSHHGETREKLPACSGHSGDQSIAIKQIILR